MRGLAVASVLLSATLAFALEPMTAKRLLPAFGGTASVWVTCLVAFQGLLLLGYLYAHAVARLERRAQIAVHVIALGVSFAVFPWRAPVAPDAGAAPLPWLIAELLRTAALPFLLLSTNATLVQHWYARRTGEAPWFLYALSNAGSLLGLLAYPLVLEPLFGLRVQSAGWLACYAVFALLSLAALVWGAGPHSPSRPPDPLRGLEDADAGPRTEIAASGVAPPRAQVARWFGRSALGATLLTATTYWITVDVGALPLAWVLPLAVYLVTFILAFSPRVGFPRQLLSLFALLPILFALLHATSDTYSGRVLLLSSLGSLFLGGWVVHGDLARDRPDAGRLTGYYLWIAAGGFAGGLAGNLVPPFLFDSIAEYPLALAVLAIVLAIDGDDASKLVETLRAPITWMLAGGTAAMLVLVHWTDQGSGPFALITILCGLLPAVVSVRTRPGLFGVVAMVVAVILAAGMLRGRELDASRSFYGVLRVEEIDGVPWLRHGTTVHGVGRLDPSEPPGTYYHPEGPLGSRVRAQRGNARIGIVGLGTGALAALCTSGQHMTFYEIDPGVEPMAREHFDYLDSSPARVDVVLGDARLTVEREADATFDLLLIDAFSSDAVPAHLLTREAMEMWLRKVKPSGEVVLHVSNRNFWLMPPVRGAVLERADVRGYRYGFVPTAEQLEERASTMLAAALTTDSALGTSLTRLGWDEFGDVEPVVWTDDHTSVLSVLAIWR